MSAINAAILAAIPVFNAQVPGEGPKTVPLLLDFSVFATLVLDYSQKMQQGNISMIQSIYIDASGTDQPMTVSVGRTAQQITVKGRTQGYYPIIAPNPFSISFTCPGGPSAMQVFLLNVPVAPGQWTTQ